MEISSNRQHFMKKVRFSQQQSNQRKIYKKEKGTRSLPKSDSLNQIQQTLQRQKGSRRCRLGPKKPWNLEVRMTHSQRRNQIGSRNEVQELERREDRHQSLCGNHLPVVKLQIDPLHTKKQMEILSLLICFSKEIPNRPISDRIKHPFKQHRSLKWPAKGREQDPTCKDLHNKERKNRVKLTTTLKKSIKMKCLTSSSRRRWFKWPMTSQITSQCWP